jgi:hypothetical protein
VSSAPVKTVQTLEIHPAAAIFPMLSDEEMTELAKSINSFGLREKISIISNPAAVSTWLVLDGRNRLEALRRMNVKEKDIIEQYCRVVDLQKMNATPEEYVMMANIERRNLTAPQRRSLAGKLAIMLAEANKELPKDERKDALAAAAVKAGVSRRTAATAKKEEEAKIAKSPQKKPVTKKKPGISVVKLVEAVLNTKKALQASGHNWPAEQLKALNEIAREIVVTSDANLARIEAEKLAEAEKILEEAKKKDEAAKKLAQSA